MKVEIATECGTTTLDADPGEATEMIAAWADGAGLLRFRDITSDAMHYLAACKIVGITTWTDNPGAP